MGEIRNPEKALSFAGIMLAPGIPLDNLSSFEDAFGAPVEIFGPVDFSSISKYYDEEMGAGIRKYYAYFNRIIDPSDLKNDKMISNRIEDGMKRSGKRTVNFDIGCIELSKLILASTKNFYHRIHLGGGIYAEVTLFYKDKHFEAFPWTYPDYKLPDVRAFVQKAREHFYAKEKH